MAEAQRFGKYMLFERIAVGGMAEVFRATPVGGDSQLALKRIHPHHLENDDFVSMLIDEAKISVQLNHPNVIQVVDLGRVENHYFIAMEFIRGRDLRRVMERLAEMQRPFPVEHAVAIIARVANGLDYAHGKSDARGKKMEIVHRDISPQNVLVGFDGTVKVIDFGIAKAAGRLMETQVGILKGKYAYMSPEQAAGGSLDHRTDIFSTGIMLYECAAGKHPFRASHDIETLRNIKNSNFAPPRELNPAIPESVERVILKALSPKKEDRYFTAGAMAIELEDALAEMVRNYSQDTLADFIDEVFADDIASGLIPDVGSPKEKVPRGGANMADRLGSGPSVPSAPGTGNSLSATAMNSPRPGQKRPSAPVNVDREGQAMVVSESPLTHLWSQTRDGVASFVARIQAGKLTTPDTVVLGAMAVIFIALALVLLLWDPAAAPKKPPVNPVASGAGTAAPLTPSALLVESNPPGATIRIANVVKGQTPVRLDGLPPNQPVAVSISKPGYVTWNGIAVPGRDHVKVDLVALPTGFVTVTSIPPGAEVRVDGNRVGVTPLKLSIGEGDHTLRIRDRSGAEESRTVHVKANGNATERFKLQ